MASTLKFVGSFLVAKATNWPSHYALLDQQSKRKKKKKAQRKQGLSSGPCLIVCMT